MRILIKFLDLYWPHEGRAHLNPLLIQLVSLYQEFLK